MKFKPYFLLFLGATLFACQNQHRSRFASAADSIKHAKVLAEAAALDAPDPRAKDEAYFLNKIKDESAYDITSNSVKKDSHIESFNKYAKDTLKEFKNWEFIVTEINDNGAEANTVGKLLGFDNGPIYNLIVVAPIKIDHSVDTISIDNRVDFTYTIPKSPKGADLKKQLSIIKTLNKGDTIIVDGAVTHLDENGKINFASFYDGMGPWNVDLMAKHIHKK